MLRRTFDPNKPYPYLRYGRMSDDEQNPRSPEQQFATIEQVRARMGYPWLHMRDFRDDAITGRLLRKRKGFQEMLQAIMTGTIVVDLILIDTYERFGRADELAAIRSELYNKYGVLVLTADSNFSDPTSVAGRALTFVEQIRSTEDGRVKAHNVLRGKRDLIRQKRAWPGGPPPFGLRLQSVMTVGKNGDQEVDYKILVRDPERDWVAAGIFQQAKDTGWGTSRLSKSLNADPTIPSKLKPFSPATIGYILDNPIYYGELLWEQNSTGIVDDTRVLERNAEEDMLRVPDFCEPIVSRELWEEVQELRQKRREQILRSRVGQKANDKQIKPLARGLTLKHLLTGLVRCGHCRASMRPSPSKCTFKSGKVWRRVYYCCPSYVGGNCPNGLYVPEDWLREVVIARLRSRLFPPPNRVGQVPDWFGPLVEEVRQELLHRAKEQPGQRPAWEHEVKELQERLSGWARSLANPRLDHLLRADIEAQYGPDRARIVQLEGLLAEQNDRESHLAEILDPGRVLARLQRLADILGGDNPTRGNLELSLHIHRIECFADGKVQMRTSRLGVFDGVVEMLRSPQEERFGQEGDGPKPMRQVQPRRRARHRVEKDFSREKGCLWEMEGATDQNRFAHLEDRWFWEDSLEIPQVSSWAQEHGAEVAQLRAAGATMEELASRFGKSVPTIRNALRKAKASGLLPRDLPKKMPRPRWPEQHFLEVAAQARQGRSMKALCAHFQRSEPLIRNALRLAEEHARRQSGTEGSPPPPSPSPG